MLSQLTTQLARKYCVSSPDLQVTLEIEIAKANKLSI